MINYKRIKIFRLLYGATIVTALVMGIAIARESYVCAARIAIPEKQWTW